MNGGLSWQEGETTAEFAGATLNLASLCVHLPDRAEAMRLAAVEKLDEEGRVLVVALAAQIEEGLMDDERIVEWDDDDGYRR